jgi:hypothetical protein
MKKNKTNYVKVKVCCEALTERLQCNNWKGILKWNDVHILREIDIYSYCPFCGAKVKKWND